MYKNLLFALYLGLLSNFSQAQCDSVVISGDLTVSTTTLMSGVYVVQGTFTIQSAATVYVTPYSSNGCGALKIYAEQINIEGNINGDYAGFVGGLGGAKGLDVTSATGHAASLTSCNDSGSEGHISVAGGFAGLAGAGPGAGNPGTNGQNGSGSKQYCGSFGDEAGVVGGAGGAGGGAGASYGGQGSNGGNGAAGSAVYNAVDLDVESSYTATAGNGGAGGTSSSVYGTTNGFDIQLGSGGAGAGGGGRSHYLGTDGESGGRGGGLVFLKAENSLSVSGTITVNGEDGKYGGSGGSGDATADCCSDGCNGCDERTFSAGSGGGSGSGAGSGGGILLQTGGTLSMSGILEAEGGTGGLGGQRGFGATCDYGGGGFCSENSITTGDGNTANEGGSGGGGRIKIFTPSCAQATISGSYSVLGGSGSPAVANGTYAEVCGYLGLNEVESFDLLVYPNPFSTEFTIELSQAQEFEYVLLDLSGKVLRSGAEFGSSFTIESNDLTAGMYVLQVTSNNAQKTLKISKK